MPRLSTHTLANSLLILALAAIPALPQQSPADQAPSTPILSAGYGATAQSQPNSQLMHLGPHSGITKPKVLYSVPPKFSEEARAARVFGMVEVYLWVDKNGNPSHIRVVRSVGHGLDESAVEAVRQYKFEPAMFNGQPVMVDLYIDVNFQIVQR